MVDTEEAVLFNGGMHTENGDGGMLDPNTDMHCEFETKTICGQELDIEVTQWPDGAIHKLKIFEKGNSVAIFYEEYDKLESIDSPARDPGLPPNGPASPVPSSPLDLRDSDSTNLSLLAQNEKKHKRLQRLQLEDDEGIVSKHTTFFPAKIKRRDSRHLDVNSDYYYDMTSFPRGTLTLLNVRNFRNSSGMSSYPRIGTDRDADGLCSLFLELGFIVERYDNPTRKIMYSALEIAATEDKLSCCACAILTHGDEGILYATDQKIEIREITKVFREKSLAGKPKLFIFQACQASDYSDLLDNVDASATLPKFFSEKERNVVLPCETDFLYAYSAVPGYFSWHNSRQGSWFVQAVCSTFREYGHSMDVYKMLTRVNDKVAKRKTNTDLNEADNNRQIASIVSQMRKDFFFFPPYGPLPLI